MDTKGTKEINIDHKQDPLYSTHPHASSDKSFKDNKKFKVLALPVDDGGCGWYRVRQYIEFFNESGLADAIIMKPGWSEAELRGAVEAADVIIARNSTDDMVQLIQETSSTPIVFDHDDNMFEILPSNEHYKDHGTDDVWVKTNEGEKPLWVTGITPGFNRYANMRKRFNLQYLLKTSDLNTSPTALLSEFWGQFNGRSAIVPNVINFKLYPELEISDPNKGDEIRIGWQGGVSHFGDFATIGPSLSKVVKANKDAVYYTVGSGYPVHYKGIEDRVRSYSWMPFKAHPFRMASLDLDIAIIPLADAPFNTYKSEVKFTEFAALGVPCLVKDTVPYVVDKSICIDGINCLTYKDEKEFEEKLQLLIDDADLRAKLSKNAHDWAKRMRNIEKWGPKVLDIYREVANV